MQACGGEVPRRKMIQCSIDQYIHNGWNMDYQALPPTDLAILAPPDALVAALARRARPAFGGRNSSVVREARRSRQPAGPARSEMDGRCAACRSTISRASRRKRSRRTSLRTSGCRSAGRASTAASRIRRTTSASTAAAASARARAWRSARRWRCAIRQRSAAGRGARRRRLPDGRDRAVDRRPLSRAAADRHRQQRIVLQRRAASGAHGAPARPAGGKSLDRIADERSGHGSRGARARAGRQRLRSGAHRRRSGRDACASGRRRARGRGGRHRCARRARICARRVGIADAPRPRRDIEEHAVPDTADKSPDPRLPQHRDLYYGGAWHRGSARDCGDEPVDGRVARHDDRRDGRRCRSRGRRGARSVSSSGATSPAQERAAAIRRASAILRQNADELAWLEAVDTGNPFQAMRFDVEISADYMDYFAGLVTEIKGDTIPIGAGTLNYTLREPLGRRRAHRRVQSSVAVHRRQMRRAARRRQHADREARRPDAAFVAAHRRAVGRRVSARRVQRRDRRARRRRRAGRASESGEDRLHRQRHRGPRGDERRRRDAQGADAGARRQECADRLRRRVAGRSRRRRRARNELPLRHRAVVQLDEPRLSARRHPRRGAGGDREARRRAQGRAAHRARHRSRVPVEPGPVRQDDELHQAGDRRRARGSRTAASARPIRSSRTDSSSSRPCSPT